MVFCLILCNVCFTEENSNWTTYFKIIDGIRVSKAVCEKCSQITDKQWLDNGWSRMSKACK
jgi:hypothetical protein